VLGLPTVTSISRCLLRLHPLRASSSPPAGRPGNTPTTSPARPGRDDGAAAPSPVDVYPTLLQVR
jgi:hypothetical protein